MQSTHYLFDFGLKSTLKHRWEMAPWFSHTLSNAGSCSRLCTQAIVYCIWSSASQRNSEKNKTFTSLPTLSNGPDPLFFQEKEKKKISTVQENSHDCEGWIAAGTPVRSTAAKLHPGVAGHKVAAEVWLIGREFFRVLALCCVYRHCLGPTFLISRRAVTYCHLQRNMRRQQLVKAQFSIIGLQRWAFNLNMLVPGERFLLHSNWAPTWSEHLS